MRSVLEPRRNLGGSLIRGEAAGVGKGWTVSLKRVYEAADDTDGYRILVDRLWPRGLSKGDARIDLWPKELAPSHELRQWFNHDPGKWREFLKRYRKELRSKQDLVDDLKQTIREKEMVTLLFAASDQDHNNAVALKSMLG